MSSQKEEYEVLELVGRGSFGQIHKVRRKRDGHILARKAISYLRMSQKEKEQLVNEFNILSKLSHPNIVQYYHREHDRAEQSLYIYMEYCGGGDLSSRIKACRAEGSLVPESVVWTIFTQIVLALHKCHNGTDAPPVTELFNRRERRRTSSGVLATNSSSKEIILHRDLKPENVFLDHENSVKLGDFGLSRILASEQHLATTYVGTPYYMSPEIVCDLPYTSRSDIWSLGCVIYELCSLNPPFNAKSHLGLCQKIKEGRYAPLPAQYSSELKRVIDMCLRVNPSERPDTGRLLDLDIMRLVRKELESAEVGKALKIKEESLKKRERELESREKGLAHQLETMAAQIKSKMALEFQVSWETKAETEIRRRVDVESKRLFEGFKASYEAEMNAKFHEALRDHINRELGNRPAKENAPSDKFADLNLAVVPGNEESSASLRVTSQVPLIRAAVMRGEPSEPVPDAKPHYVLPPSPMDISMSSPVPTPRFPYRNMTQGSPLQKRGSNLSKMVRCHSAAVAVTNADLSSDDDDDYHGPATSKPPPPRPFPLINMKSAPVLSQALDLQSAVHHRNKRAKPLLGARLFHKDAALTTTSTLENAQQHSISGWPSNRSDGDELDGGQFLAVKPATIPPPKAKSLAELAKEAKMRSRENKDLNKENEFGVPVWDPEVDEMPSPFLSRRKIYA